jgi:hypothetical protein
MGGTDHWLIFGKRSVLRGSLMHHLAMMEAGEGQAARRAVGRLFRLGGRARRTVPARYG